MSPTTGDTARRKASATSPIAVLVPFRSDDDERSRLWHHVHDWWAATAWPTGHFGAMVAADGGTQEHFSRSVALNAAAANAGDWDLAVIADADTIPVLNQLLAAIQVARATCRLTVAHSEWVNVEPDELARFLTLGAVPHRTDRTIVSLGASSMLAIPRELWDRAGGFDETFRGWGYEDRAFFRVCEILAGGVERIHGPVYHLGHERPRGDRQRNRDPQFVSNHKRWLQYRRCRTAIQLQELVAE